MIFMPPNVHSNPIVYTFLNRVVLPRMQPAHSSALSPYFQPGFLPLSGGISPDQSPGPCLLLTF